MVDTDNLSVHTDDNLPVSSIMSGADVVCWVLESDAELNGMTRDQLAHVWKDRIGEAIDEYRRARTAESFLKYILFAVIATVAMVALLLLIRMLVRREMMLIEQRLAGRRMFKLVDGDSIITINGYMIRLIRFLLVAWLLVGYITLILSFFPWTFNLSAKLFSLIKTPLTNFGQAFVENLPNLAALLIIVAIVYFFLRGVKHIFEQIGEGKVRIRGFYPDWADTTYRLVRMVVLVFAVVAAFPYIPGSSSPAFKGISIFMGVLLSLGSTSAVGNIFGGLMLTYMRSFMPGDFVEINGLKGTVMSRRTFSTRLKTPTNEIISIPNSAVSTNHIINYSNMTKSVGVNIGTSVTIGYDVPWRTVHDLLIQAAAEVEDVLDDPAPTVFQLGLEDFYVTYQLLVSTKRPDRMRSIRSRLHENIQDRFASAGVEIMSPHFQANRDGGKPALPECPGEDAQG